MSWLSLSETEVKGREVRMRFVPDTLVHEEQTPVVEVTIEEAENPERMIEALAKFRDDFVIELDASDQALHLVGEMDCEETVLRGGRVSVRRVAYSAGELLAIAASLHQTANEETLHAFEQSEKLRDIRHFVADLIERAERRLAMSDRANGAIEAQLSALNRVLRRLDDP